MKYLCPRDFRRGEMEERMFKCRKRRRKSKYDTKLRYCYITLNKKCVHSDRMVEIIISKIRMNVHKYRIILQRELYSKKHLCVNFRFALFN